MSATPTSPAGRPRVLIVEDDPHLAMAMIRECDRLGLEPKLCRGPAFTSDCPGLRGDDCPRVNNIEATLVSITSGDQRRAAPACVGGKVVVTGERPLLGSVTAAVLHADERLPYPYDPKDAAGVLAALVPADSPAEAAS